MKFFEKIKPKLRNRKPFDESVLSEVPGWSEDPFLAKWLDGLRLVNGESRASNGEILDGWLLLSIEQMCEMSSGISEILADVWESKMIGAGVCLFRTHWKTDVLYVSQGFWAGGIVHVDSSLGRAGLVARRSSDFVEFIESLSAGEKFALPIENQIDYRFGMTKASMQIMLQIEGLSPLVAFEDLLLERIEEFSAQ
jgi:hypothetical protein